MPEYGHLLRVELIGLPVDQNDARVSDALRHAIGSRVRLWRIDPVGGDVEDLIAAAHVEGPCPGTSGLPGMWSPARA